MTGTPFVIDSADDFRPDDLFLEGRDQVLVAVRIAPMFGQVDLGLVATVVDEASARGLTVAREHLLRDEYVLLMLEVYDEDE